MNNVCVLGSINMDIVVNVLDMPLEGQTILGENISFSHGGKGANQAVASKRTGSNVSFIGRVGKDSYGDELLKKLRSEDISVDGIYIDEKESTGTAIITINKIGQNSIVVVPGANMAIDNNQLDNMKNTIKNCEILISQFETPLKVTIESFKFAKENGIVTILNPAPVQDIPKDLLRYTDIIVPNETEIEGLTNIKVKTLEDAQIAAKSFFNEGVKVVIITVGDKGAFLLDKYKALEIPTYKVNAIDTTAAGDSFIGALSSKIDVKNINVDSMASVVKFANKVAGVTVQKKGAQDSIPYMK